MDIAIIGFSGNFPGQKTTDIHSLWDPISKGVSAVSDIPKDRWNTQNSFSNGSYCNKGGFIKSVDEFDHQFFNISPAEAEYMDPQQRLLMQTAYHAIESAGLTMKVLSNSSCGVYIGQVNNDYFDLISNSGLPHHPTEMIGNYSSVLAGRIAYFFNLKGPTLTVDTACSSSLMAVHLACQGIAFGKTNLAIAGGVSLNLAPRTYDLMNISGMLSPTGMCSTFDDNANGFVPGEGVGVIMLKKLETALADGDRIWGVVKNTGSMQDGKTNGISSPNALSQAALISTIYDQIGVDINRIGLLETHGTGTKLGDPIELESLKKVFKNSINGHVCSISSIKPNIGHTLGAAGIAGIIKVLLCLHYRKIPPQANFKKLNSFIDLDGYPFKINTALTSWDVIGEYPRLAGVSSFGFSGTNVHLLIEEFKQTANKPTYREPKSDGLNDTAKLFAFSTKTASSMKQRLKEFAVWLNHQNEQTSLEKIQSTLYHHRDHFKLRFVFIAASKQELQRLILKIHKESDCANSAVWCLERTKQAENYQAICQTADEYIRLGRLDSKIKLEKYQPISLPLYPFDTQSFWFDKNISKEVELPSQERVQPHCFSNASSSIELREEMFDKLAEVLNVPRPKLSNETLFSDLGADSIILLDFINSLKNIAKLESSVIFEYPTIGALFDHVLELASGNGTFKPNNANKKIIPCKVDTEENFDEVAIIGLACEFPGSHNIEQYWGNLLSQSSGFSKLSAVRSTQDTLENDFYAGWLREIDFTKQAMSNHHKLISDSDMQTKLCLKLVGDVMVDAGYTIERFSNNNIGVFVGAKSLSSITSNQNHIASLSSFIYDLSGPSVVIDTACASSLYALNYAVMALKTKQISAAIAGGVSILSKEMLEQIKKTNSISPTQQYQAFSTSANGYLTGEGGGLVMLKRLEDAKRDGDKIYALFKDIQVNNNARGLSLTALNMDAQYRLLKQSWDKLLVGSNFPEYIECNATASEVGDLVELKVLQKLLESYNDKISECYIGSSKLNVGHLLSASSMPGLIKLILSLYRKTWAPTKAITSPISYLNSSKLVPCYKAVSWEPNINKPKLAAISAYAEGGSNAHAIIEEYL